MKHRVFRIEFLTFLTFQHVPGILADLSENLNIMFIIIIIINIIIIIIDEYHHHHFQYYRHCYPYHRHDHHQSLLSLSF